MRTRWKQGLAVVAVVATGAAAGAAPAAQATTPKEPDPLVIGHRGASGYLPEHTLESYALAIELGADYVEPDLVATKDGHLVARHEPNIGSTTDVGTRPEFADRKRTREVDGVPVTDFFASDFTLAELRTLRAIQPNPARPQGVNGRFRIPTLREVIALVKRKGREVRRRVGIYPETKHPTYHRRLGLPLERRLVRILREAGWTDRHDPVFVQSFETANLRELNRLVGVRLVQLIDANDVNPDGTLDYTPPYDRPYDFTVAGDPRLFSDLVTDAGLDFVRTYADGIGPWKPYVISSTLEAGAPLRSALAPTDLVARAHARGLVVHPYTFRNEPSNLTVQDRGNPVEEYLRFYAAGVDGVFSDFPDTAYAARAIFRLAEAP